MFVAVERALLTLAFFACFAGSVCQAEMVSIAKEKVNMRAGPGKKYSVLWELGKGFPLRVLDARGNWLKIIDFEQDVGWVHRSLVAKTPHLIVKGKRVNVRSGAGTRYRIVGKANHGVVFRTLDHKHGWAKVRHESGMTGWIKRSLLWGW